MEFIGREAVKNLVSLPTRSNIETWTGPGLFITNKLKYLEELHYQTSSNNIIKLH